MIAKLCTCLNWSKKNYNDAEAQWKKKSVPENSESTPIFNCMFRCHATSPHCLVFPRIWMNQESKWILEISVVCCARLYRIKSLCKPLYWMRSNLTVIVNKWLPARVRKLEMLIWSSSCLQHYESLQSGLSIDMQNMQLVAEREPKLSNT